jgi:WhiB family transcriptional regulator, redox-sensing transcriptional regulator
VTADRSGTGRLGTLVLPRGAEVGWQQDAACKDVPDPDVFFPGKGEDAEAAKQICAGCPVLGECLEFALATMRAADRDHGVYGGLTPTERARLRGGPVLVRGPRLDSRVQAVIGYRLANRIGLDSAARALGVTPEALADAWQRRGRLSPPLQPSRRQSVDERLYQDRAWAEQALALTSQLGIRRAAFVLGVTHGVLYRAWQHHGLDRPAHQPRQRSAGLLRAAAGPRAGMARRSRGGDGREEVGDRDRR